MSDSTLAQIGRALALATEPLTSRLEGGHARRFFNMLGVDVPLTVFTPALENAFASTASAAAVLQEVLPELIAAVEAENTGEIIAKSVEIVEQVRAIVVAVETIVNEIENIGVPGLTAADLGAFMGDVAQRASELVLVEHLQTYLPVVFTILHFFGVVEIKRANVGVPDMQLVEYERKRLRFDRIVDPRQEHGLVEQSHAPVGQRRQRFDAFADQFVGVVGVYHEDRTQAAGGQPS